MTTKAQKAEQAEAIERLRQWVKPGDTIYCVLRHVSASGMSRVIDLKVVDCNDRRDPISHVGYNVALALGMTYDRKKEGIRIGGAGMDMGFALVYDLSYTLFKDGFQCLAERCPSNDHSNGDRDYSGATWHTSGGYALKHRWL